SDVYALGCVLYELVVGQPPFPARTLADAVHQHVYRAPTPPSGANTDVSADLEAMILRALAKRPGERFQSAAELGAALGGVEPRSVTMPPPGRDDATAAHAAETLVESSPRETSWGNLSAPLTGVVGRDEELGELEALLGRARLVTLTGPGGTGKTRLAQA